MYIFKFVPEISESNQACLYIANISHMIFLHIYCKYHTSLHISKTSITSCAIDLNEKSPHKNDRKPLYSAGSLSI